MTKSAPQFWLDYANGKLADLAAFVDSAIKRRRSNDAPDTSVDRFFGAMADGAYFNAPERLKFPSLMTDESMLRRHERADWQNTDLRIRVFAARMIEAARKRGVPLYVHSAYRTATEQAELYAKGRTKTRWPRAAHCQGRAVDIVHGAFHWDMTPQEWALLGKLGRDVAQRLGIEVTWGGGWAFYDPAHWEISDWATDIREDLPETAPLRKTPRGLLVETRGYGQ